MSPTTHTLSKHLVVLSGGVLSPAIIQLLTDTIDYAAFFCFAEYVFILTFLVISLDVQFLLNTPFRK